MVTAHQDHGYHPRQQQQRLSDRAITPRRMHGSY
jgi:hypothetical protein